MRCHREGLRSWFRARAIHPCHIRFEDLNRFVYLTKTERFDELATLMGFAKQVEMHKQLRRVEGRLADQVAAARRTCTGGSAIASAPHPFAGVVTARSPAPGAGP